MIKTLKEDECRFLRRILPHYVRHMTRNPHSLINRYYGLHRVKMPHLRRKIHFVVMNNIFQTPKPIHTMYDLKGATYHGRYVKHTKIMAKSHMGQDVCRKDLNFQGYTSDKKPGSKKIKNQPDGDWRQWLKIGEPRRKLIFADQIAADAVFLAKMKIMDYSLLVGVHGRDPLQVPGYVPPKDRGSEDDEDDEDVDEDDEDDEFMEDEDNDADALADAYNYHEEDSFEESSSQQDGSSESGGGESKTSGKGGGSSGVVASSQSVLRMRTEDLNNEMNDAHRKEFERRQTSGWQSDEEDGESEKPPYNDEGEIVVSAQEMQRMENERRREKDKIDEEEMKRIEMEEKDVKIPLSVFQRDDGGFWGMNADGTPNNEIYYVGIIDILQQYNMIKFTENKWKSWFGSAGATKISALPPKKYARRFIEFITGSIK